MALYKITVIKNPADIATMWKEKNTTKAAYEYGIEQGTDIFGIVPDGIQVTEEKPEEV